MTFQTTPTGYEKTILSDLQVAWSIFREAVADLAVLWVLVMCCFIQTRQ